MLARLKEMHSSHSAGRQLHTTLDRAAAHTQVQNAKNRPCSADMLCSHIPWASAQHTAMAGFKVAFHAHSVSISTETRQCGTTASRLETTYLCTNTVLIVGQLATTAKTTPEPHSARTTYRCQQVKFQELSIARKHIVDACF